MLPAADQAQSVPPGPPPSQHSPILRRFRPPIRLSGSFRLRHPNTSANTTPEGMPWPSLSVVTQSAAREGGLPQDVPSQASTRRRYSAGQAPGDDVFGGVTGVDRLGPGHEPATRQVLKNANKLLWPAGKPEVHR